MRSRVENAGGRLHAPFILEQLDSQARYGRSAFAQGGAKGMIRWQLERLLKEAKNHYVSPVQLASCYAQLGDREHALSLLEEGYRQRSTDVLWVPGKPEYEFLHADGRYQMVVQHLAASPIP